ncbi:MAG: kynureninase [Thermoanaerobaculia bacterium]
MPLRVEDLAEHPNPLSAHYAHFRVAERLLLSGHSHQAWPDVGFEAQQRAWLDAAEHVDGKWERAMAQANAVKEGYRRLLDDPSGRYSLAASTHDLLVKLLSALPLAERPKLVATDLEFHSLRRQLDRLAEAGLEIVRVPALPAADAGERLAAAVDDRTAAALISTVFYANAHIAGGLTAAADACRRHGTVLVLDVYHQLNVVPFSLREQALEDAYVVGGGYKYCQLGEGCAFLRYPADCALRPVATGWFAEFAELSALHDETRVAYDSENRFAGGTYDPTSHYRGAAVFRFFAEQHLTPPLLREISQHQIGLLAERFDALDLDPTIVRRDRSLPLEALGGFLAVASPHAGELHCRLLTRGVYTDYRAQVLRLGPAPYLSDGQLRDAMAHLGKIARTL